MTVTFCGHSKVYSESKEVTEKLTKIVEELINEGADEFLLGGYGHFDHISARVVKNLKEKYPHITSRLVIPYLNRKYDMKLYDDSVYPPIETTPLRFAISKRNEYINQISLEKVNQVIKKYFVPQMISVEIGSF